MSGARILLPLLALVSAHAHAAPLGTADAARLRPGGWLWSADAPAGAVTIDVNRRRQIASVYRGGVLIGLAAVSTGKPGHGTPAGEFTILEKEAVHRSSRYQNASMPYMQRLTWDGIAIHAGRNPGFPASHGCIRVPLPFARLLFGVTQLGAVVRVRDEDAPGGWAIVDTSVAPPKASWLDQSQDDYVSWGGRWATR